MQGSILCSAALGACTMAICVLSFPAAGGNSYIFAAVLIIVGVVLAKLGIDDICNNAQVREKMTAQIISEIVNNKNSLVAEINGISVTLQGQEEHLTQIINTLQTTCGDMFENIAKGLNQVNTLIKEQKQDFAFINATVCEKIEDVLEKIQEEKECVIKIETFVKSADEANIKNIKLLERQLTKNKDYLESIKERLKALDYLCDSIEKCNKVLKTYRVNFEELKDNIDEQSSELNKRIEDALESFKEQNTLHRKQLEDMQKRYTSLSKKDMELLAKLCEDSH